MPHLPSLLANAVLLRDREGHISLLLCARLWKAVDASGAWGTAAACGKLSSTAETGCVAVYAVLSFDGLDDRTSGWILARRTSCFIHDGSVVVGLVNQ
jgi:hypothetical protein